MWSDFTLRHSFKVKQVQPVLQCETNLLDIMGWEYSDVVQNDLGPILQGQSRIAKLKSAHNLLISDPRGFGMVNQPIGNHQLLIFWCDRI